MTSGDAESAADLDQLAAGDDDFPSAGDGGQHQQRARGVVVRQDGSLASEERAAEPGQMPVAAAARSFVEIKFEIGVARRDCSARDQMAGSMGERPRFVWMMTPEPLITRRRVEAVAAASWLRASAAAAFSSKVRANREGLPDGRQPRPSRALARTRK